jgi:hypothetical protein
LVNTVRERTGMTIPLALVLAPITAVGGVVVVGAGVFAARRDWFIPLYLAASAGLICLTPWPQQFPRYLAPLAPFLSLCLVVALRALRAYAQRKGSRRWRWTGNTCFAVVIGLVLGTDAVVDTHAYLFSHRVVLTGEDGRGGRLFFYDQKWEELDAALAWLREQSQPEDVVATVAPHWTYLRTGRKAVMPPMEADPGRAQELLDSVPVTYLVVDDLEFSDIINVSRHYAAPVVEKHPLQWRLVYTSPAGHTSVYERVR